MFEITLTFIALISIILLPTIIPYLALLFLFAQGWAFMYVSTLKFKLSSISIYPLDLLYATSVIYALLYFIKFAFNNQFKATNVSATRSTVMIILLYVFFFVGKAINGFFEGVPIDTILRLTMTYTQVFYFFFPLVIYNNIKQLKKLLYFTVLLSILFPLGQPFLINSELTTSILHGQGTLRLGYGDASILLALGVIAFFCWERKRHLASLPLAGIFMLAHRSAFLGIAIALVAQSFLRGKQIKTLLVIAISVFFMIGLIAIASSFTKVDILGKSLNRAGETFKATGTTISRFDVIFTALEELEKRPMTGLTYKEAHDLQNLANNNNARAFNILTPHNFVLNSIIKQGLIGTIILFLLIFSSLRSAYKISLIEQLNCQGSYLYGAMLFCIVFGLMNNTMEGVGYLFWFLCGTAFWFLNNQSLLSKT